MLGAEVALYWDRGGIMLGVIMLGAGGGIMLGDRGGIMLEAEGASCWGIREGQRGHHAGEPVKDRGGIMVGEGDISTHGVGRGWEGAGEGVCVRNRYLKIIIFAACCWKTCWV